MNTRHMTNNTASLYREAGLDVDICITTEGSAENLGMLPYPFVKNESGLYVPSGKVSQVQTVADWAASNAQVLGAAAWATKAIPGLHEKIKERPVVVQDTYMLLVQNDEPAGYLIQTLVENGIPGAFDTDFMLRKGVMRTDAYSDMIGRVNALCNQGDMSLFTVLGTEAGVYHKMGFTGDFWQRNEVSTTGNARRAMRALAMTHTE